MSIDTLARRPMVRHQAIVRGAHPDRLERELGALLASGRLPEALRRIRRALASGAGEVWSPQRWARLAVLLRRYVEPNARADPAVWAELRTVSTRLRAALEGDAPA